MATYSSDVFGRESGANPALYADKPFGQPLGWSDSAKAPSGFNWGSYSFRPNTLGATSGFGAGDFTPAGVNRLRTPKYPELTGTFNTMAGRLGDMGNSWKSNWDNFQNTFNTANTGITGDIGNAQNFVNSLGQLPSTLGKFTTDYTGTVSALNNATKAELAANANAGRAAQLGVLGDWRTNRSGAINTGRQGMLDQINQWNTNMIGGINKAVNTRNQSAALARGDIYRRYASTAPMGYVGARELGEAARTGTESADYGSGLNLGRINDLGTKNLGVSQWTAGQNIGTEDLINPATLGVEGQYANTARANTLFSDSAARDLASQQLNLGRSNQMYATGLQGQFLNALPQMRMSQAQFAGYPLTMGSQLTGADISNLGAFTNALNNSYMTGVEDTRGGQPYIPKGQGYPMAPYTPQNSGGGGGGTAPSQLGAPSGAAYDPWSDPSLDLTEGGWARNPGYAWGANYGGGWTNSGGGAQILPDNTSLVGGGAVNNYGLLGY